ncbi:hypothetical protein F2Q68_00028765 [Brassica cretica]|uniref:beta-galactosidase n=1 Tax=Brassica cretica TaxID=69181 RepID=A0A8S9GGX0_BRACR|nr:hypothetical protein F2Q68_00028765 [Brassica cretica]
MDYWIAGFLVLTVGVLLLSWLWFRLTNSKTRDEDKQEETEKKKGMIPKGSLGWPIENEYGRQGQLLGAEGHNYMTWAAKMAIATETGVPWVMCKEDDAPDPVINTCNGFYCDSFAPNKPYKPLIWTEAWSGWFTEFGGPMHHRPVQDLAFAVARFIQKGGSFVNYYMYHGGTNFGRTAGGPFVTTSYDYDAPIDEYGLIREPKYGHLKELHRAIKMCEKALVSTDPVVTSLGNKQQAHVYSSESGDCSAFLANYDTESAARVLFNNVHYNLPPWSISILPDCRNAVFNTAKVGVQTSQMEMLPTSTPNFQWQSYLEDLSSLDDSSTFTTQGLLEQINVTRDTSDYLWYMTSPGQAISAIKFASFGTPLGKCGSYQQGECHAATSYAILERKCVGKARCAVTISNSNFGKDPCPNVLKRLTVEAVCAPETSITGWKP